MDLPPGPVLEKDDLLVQLCPSHIHPSKAEATTNCSSKQVAKGQAQIVSGIGMHQSLSKRPKPIHPDSDNFRAGSNKLHK